MRYDGTWIRVGLARRDWPASTLAEKTGLSVGAIYNYLAGRNRPKPDAERRMRNVLNSTKKVAK